MGTDRFVQCSRDGLHVRELANTQEVLTMVQRNALGQFVARDPVERFWEKVDKSGPFPRDPLIMLPDGCWLWTALINPRTGYAQFHPNRTPVLAHRWAYEVIRGDPIPVDMEIDHLCRVRHCVNPDHMELVTHRENQWRGNGPTGINHRKTHCKRGHPFDDENTYYHELSGQRSCRACHAMRERRRRRERQA